MYLLWLRVAAILYAAGAVAVFPAVLYSQERWRRWCVHLGGMAVFFHFVSVVEMLVQAHRLMPVGEREIESLLGFAVAGIFFLVWWLYDGISLGIFALPATFFLVFIPALGPNRYRFPSQSIYDVWLVAHIIALLLAYAALFFSLVSSMLYLVQERRIKSKRKPDKTSKWGPLEWLPPLDTLERVALATLEFGFPMHDCRPHPGLHPGSGDLGRRILLPQSRHSRCLRYVDHLRHVALYAPQRWSCADARPLTSPASRWS